MAGPVELADLSVWAEHYVWPNQRDKFIAWCARRPPGWEPARPNPLLDDHWSAFAQYARGGEGAER